MRKPDINEQWWAVMTVVGWDTFTLNGAPLVADKWWPDGYIPVFNTREKAVEWSASDKDVREIRTCLEPSVNH